MPDASLSAGGVDGSCADELRDGGVREPSTDSAGPPRGPALHGDDHGKRQSNKADPGRNANRHAPTLRTLRNETPGSWREYRPPPPALGQSRREGRYYAYPVILPPRAVSWRGAGNRPARRGPGPQPTGAESCLDDLTPSVTPARKQLPQNPDRGKRHFPKRRPDSSKTRQLAAMTLRNTKTSTAFPHIATTDGYLLRKQPDSRAIPPPPTLWCLITRDLHVAAKNRGVCEAPLACLARACAKRASGSKREGYGPE